MECVINDNNFLLKKYDDSVEYNVILNKFLDREEKFVYIVIIICSDVVIFFLSVIIEFIV